MKKRVLGVVGLGYVGLPLAVEFGKAGFRVIGYDCDKNKIAELSQGKERMSEVDISELKKANLELTDRPDPLREADIIIIAVPTPVDKANVPNMSILHQATKTVGKVMKKGVIVTFESTVYPGATEEECLPILEEQSGLEHGKDFTIGYSPERVNPGDKEHTIPKIIKIVSGSDKKTTDILADTYGSIVKAGIHRAPNIKTAETSKVIENCQRDINIALMNELSLICDKLGIKTLDVIDAATTKWNIHRYTPGLVGGHCISVDPYYLVHKAQQLGIHPQVLTAGRRINDSMPLHIAQLTIEGLIETGKTIKGSSVLIMGLTFKENCKDTRNAKITETINELVRLKVNVTGYDPLIEKPDLHEYTHTLTFTKDLPKNRRFDAIIVSVGHNEFKKINQKTIIDLSTMGVPVMIDVKSLFTPAIVGSKGIYRSL